MSDDEMSRLQEKFADKQTKLHTEGVSWLPVLFNLSALVSGFGLAGLNGFFLGLYVVIGVSLARRVTKEGFIVKWLAVVLFWPILLVFDVGKGVFERV